MTHPSRDDATPDGRRQPADHDRDAQVVLVRSGGLGGWSIAVAIAVVAIVGVAVLKPWVAADAPAPHGSLAPARASYAPPGSAAARSATSATSATSAASAASAASATGPGDRDPGGQCELGEAWRVFTVEIDAGRLVTSWLPVEPVAASGPESAAIPVVLVVADRVTALGFCAGMQTGTRRRITAVHAWTGSRPGRFVPVDLAPLAAWTPPDPDTGRVFVESDGFGSVDGGWTPGDYVFVVRHGPAVPDSDWFGVRIVASSRGATASTSPRASPVATMPRPAAPSAPAAP